MTTPDLDPTRIGCVRHVLGARVTVELDPDIAGIAPVYRGRLQPVGQIGSLVRIPQGLVEEFVTEERRAFAASAEWLALDPAAITADSPVPFDMREVWYRLEYENNATYGTKGDDDTVCLIEPGDAGSLAQIVRQVPTLEQA